MKPLRPQATLKEILEAIIDEMVEKGIFWHEASAQFEKLFVIRALVQNQGNLSRAADTMGVHRNTLTKKVRQYRIDRSKYRGAKVEKLKV